MGKTYKILDISSYQDPKFINYASLATDVDGVILRIGYTGWGTGSSYYKDRAFETHYKSLKAQGVPVGGYWYSCANNPGEGRAEAVFAYNCIRGKTFELPIFWDTEDSHHQAKATISCLTSVGKEFLDYFEQMGFFVGVYGSASWLKTRLNMNELAAYDVWVAHYGVAKPKYDGHYGLWQYSSSETVRGIRGQVDMSVTSFDYPTLIKEKGLNGFRAVDPVKPRKDIINEDQVAQDVIDGRYGDGDMRVRALERAGFDPVRVQKLVNDRMNHAETPKLLKEERATFRPNCTILARNKPTLLGRVVGTYYPGNIVCYSAVHECDGYLWLEIRGNDNGKRYMACRTYRDGKRGPLWGVIR